MRRPLAARIATLAIAAAAPSIATGLEVKLDLRGAAPPLDGDIVITGGAPPDADTVLPLASSIVLPAGSAGATVTCRGPGIWCPELPLRGDDVTLPVFATMTVTGTISGPGAGATLTKGTVQGVVASGERSVPFEFGETVPLQGASFSFVAPRTRLDLRFAFPGAAPVYRWGLEPPAEAVNTSSTLPLGNLILHPGASLIGWARQRNDELPIAGAKVVALPVASAEHEMLPLHTWKSSTDGRGFFQLHGLEPGTYQLEISAAGQIPQVLEAVELAPRTETVLGVVLLDAPIRLSVEIEPPSYPGGDPWTLDVSPVRRLPGEDRMRIRVGEDGNGQITSLRPVDYYVTVRTAEGEELLFERHHLVGDTRLSLVVPLVEVEGTLRLGGEPLSATIELQTGAGDRVELTSNEDGELAGWMRRPERPTVSARVKWREGRELRERTVQVLASIEDNAVELHVDLPAGAVYGEVVDAEGKPKSRFRVIATPADEASVFTRIHGETDDSGRFHLTGLASERYFLQAGGNGAPTSDVVLSDLSDGVPVDDVRLVVWPTRELVLQVTSMGRPVAGATVALAALGRLPVSLESRTDGRGDANFDIPEAVERAVVTVFAPSRLLWSGCLPIEGERLPLALPAPPGGTLTISLAGRNDLPTIPGGRDVLLTGDGGFVPYGVFLHWNRLRNASHGIENDGPSVVQSLQLPALAPGGYALTWSRAPEWELAARACAGTFAELDWVTLAPGGNAHLGLDTTDQQRTQLEALKAASRR